MHFFFSTQTGHSIRLTHSTEKTFAVLNRFLARTVNMLAAILGMPGGYQPVNVKAVVQMQNMHAYPDAIPQRAFAQVAAGLNVVVEYSTHNGTVSVHTFKDLRGVVEQHVCPGLDAEQVMQHARCDG